MTSIIKVDEIQSKNGTSALTIDSSGRILQPAKPAFKMEITDPSPSAANYTGYTYFLPDTMIFNIGNHAEITGTKGQFTCPVNGVYYFSYSINFSSGNSSSYLDVHMLKNNELLGGGTAGGGSNIDTSVRYLEDVQGGTYQTGVNTGLLQLSANDVICLEFVLVGDTSATLRDGSFFQGFLVS